MSESRKVVYKWHTRPTWFYCRTRIGVPRVTDNFQRESHSKTYPPPWSFCESRSHSTICVSLFLLSSTLLHPLPLFKTSSPCPFRRTSSLDKRPVTLSEPLLNMEETSTESGRGSYRSRPGTCGLLVKYDDSPSDYKTHHIVRREEIKKQTLSRNGSSYFTTHVWVEGVVWVLRRSSKEWGESSVIWETGPESTGTPGPSLTGSICLGTSLPFSLIPTPGLVS